MSLFRGLVFGALRNRQYCITAMTDASGNVVERYAYSPYGTPYYYDGSWNSRSSSSYGNLVLFAGYRYDHQSGLYEVRHRMYNPSLGKWMQRDPMGTGTVIPGIDIDIDWGDVATGGEKWNDRLGHYEPYGANDAYFERREQVGTKKAQGSFKDGTPAVTATPSKPIGSYGMNIKCDNKHPQNLGDFRAFSKLDPKHPPSTTGSLSKPWSTYSLEGLLHLPVETSRTQTTVKYYIYVHQECECKKGNIGWEPVPWRGKPSFPYSQVTTKTQYWDWRYGRVPIYRYYNSNYQNV